MIRFSTCQTGFPSEKEALQAQADVAHTVPAAAFVVEGVVARTVAPAACVVGEAVARTVDVSAEGAAAACIVAASAVAYIAAESAAD